MAIEQELKKENPSHKEFQALLDAEFKNKKVKEGEIIKAVITEITPKFVVVDANLKMESMIPIEEFKNKNDDELSKLKVNSTVEVFLERIENAKGEVVISRDKARKLKSWKIMVEKFESQEELTGYIVGKVRGGYICEVESLPCFLPSSQVDTKPLRRADHLFNVPLKVICTKLDKSRGNCCVSRRQVLEKSKNAEIAKALKNIKEGDVIENAIVKATTDWGIFLDINGVDALLHVSDISHGRVKKPSDFVEIGQKLKVKIVKCDRKTNRLSASVKALTGDPYENIEQRYEIGKNYEGTVSKLMPYGAFIRIEDGIEGLIHNSELDFKNRNILPSKVLSVSEKIKFKVVSIDKTSKRISLSYKAANGTNPWEKIKEKLDKEVTIKVTNVTDKSVFGTLTDSGLTGMMHFREISYEENVEDLKKFKKNDIVNVKIISVQDDKIRFSKRLLERDPMDWFKENNKKIGSVISTKVVEVLKTGVKVAVDPEKKIIVTIKKNLLAIEPADCRPEIYSPGNTMADAKIQELDTKNRKVVLSPRAAQIDEEKSLVAKFGEGAQKSGATLKSLFDKAIGSKKKKKEVK